MLFVNFCTLGIESFPKLGDSIYFEEEGKVPGLYIIQYIPSSFQWRSGGFLINQTIIPVVSWDNRLRVTVAISSEVYFVNLGELIFFFLSYTMLY